MPQFPAGGSIRTMRVSVRDPLLMRRGGNIRTAVRHSTSAQGHERKRGPLFGVFHSVSTNDGDAGSG
jgi:hypothetical protein